MSTNSSFNRSFYALAGVLAVLCLALLMLTTVQGPRLRHAQLDRSKVTAQPNQRLILYASQQLAGESAKRVSIVPKAGFTATVSGNAIVVQFSERLRYNTRYTVKAPGVKVVPQQRQATLTYTFKTADPTLYYIHRNYPADTNNTSKKPDEIVRTTLGTTKRQTIFTAPKIQDYVLLGDSIVVATINDDNTTSLQLVDVRTKKVQHLSLPAKGMLGHLRSAPNRTAFGFSFTSNEQGNAKAYEDNLFIVDLSRGRTAYPVNGLNRKPLQIIDWQFAPDGTTVLAQTYDLNALLIDTVSHKEPIPLGRVAALGNFSYNGAKIALDSQKGDPFIFDAVKHTPSAVQTPKIAGGATYPRELLLLPNSEGYVQQVQLVSNHGLTITPYILLNRQGMQRQLYRASPKTDISSYYVSPNDHLVAVEAAAIDVGAYDTYANNPKSTNVHTLLVDTASKDVVKDISGFNVTWQ
ncbi:MAG TPA: hypothetical protein VMY99_00275 [Nevskiaceae bacterium]|nr:hypothetical protein [Nevskiaceae bacterium]